MLRSVKRKKLNQGSTKPTTIGYSYRVIDTLKKSRILLLYSWKFCKIVLRPLEIPRPKTKHQYKFHILFFFSSLEISLTPSPCLVFFWNSRPLTHNLSKFSASVSVSEKSFLGNYFFYIFKEDKTTIYKNFSFERDTQWKRQRNVLPLVTCHLINSHRPKKQKKKLFMW